MNRPAITQAQKLAVLRQYAFAHCYKCKRELPIAECQIDHIQALVDGGEHDPSNMAPICADCHKVKSAFEHIRNSKTKRIIAKRERPRPPSRLRSRGFDKTKTRKFNGIVEIRK